MGIARILWFLLGSMALILAVIGIFLPILPTVPFLLLAAVGFGKSSERIHNWLVNHVIFGPPINEWRKNGAITRRVKIYATLSMAASVGLTFVLSIGLIIVSLQAILLACVAVFIWSRPEN